MRFPFSLSIGVIMNKVIARLKQLASPLKKWGDVLDIFLNHSFNEYKGFAVTPISSKFTLSIRPVRKSKGNVPASADAKYIQFGLHSGKVASDASLIDTIEEEVGDFNSKAVTLLIREWLKKNGVPAADASPTAKEVGKAYEYVLKGGLSSSSKSYSSSTGRKPKAQSSDTEIPLESMNPVSKRVFKMMKSGYAAKAVGGKMISIELYGTTIDCSIVKNNACIEFNRGSKSGYSVVTVPLPSNPAGLPDTLGRARKQMVSNEPELFSVMYLYLTLLSLED